MKDMISTFFLVVGSIAIIATYMRSKVTDPDSGSSPSTLAVCSFALAFTMLATAGAIMFG